AVMRFLLLYAGVFALIGLTAAVGIGLVATDRVVMLPGGRIIAQAVHRAVSFGAVGFLVIHIAVEVLAGRSGADDAVVPFLDHGRTLYLGLGTISSDLLVLIMMTGILRGRFAVVGPAWAWRALHAAAYLAWPLAILHGLLAGRTAKPYVDWSYGACAAAVGLALVVRLVVASRVRETPASPVPAQAPWLAPGWLAPGRLAQDRRRALPAIESGHDEQDIFGPAQYDPDLYGPEPDTDPGPYGSGSQYGNGSAPSRLGWGR
ncbi:MAG TPA: hypothetical protein VMV17_00570, partial [Streptosporangiaceae bacterium]|nr:hypothetical protein [Streptosporangiaceae bacterium]